MSVILVGACPEKITYCKSHSHPNWEIVTVISGEGYVETPKEKIPFSEGTVYCVPPNCKHSTHSQTGFLDIYIHTENLLLNPTKVTAVTDGAIPQLGVLILSAYLKKEQGWRGTMESTLGLITQLIYDLTAETTRNPLTTRLRDHLIANLSNPDLSTENVAAHFGYHPDYLRRIFKKEYSLSPMEFVWERRLHRACELLSNMPQYTIEEVANLCGFADRFYFSRFFKKHKGVSPKQYRTQP